jgi:hypothetical protein
MPKSPYGFLAFILCLAFTGICVDVYHKYSKNHPITTEHLSIEGHIKGVEIYKPEIGSPVIVIAFEDGRVKFFKNQLPDMVKQGSKNKISYKRTSRGDGSFVDEIEGLTSVTEMPNTLKE